MRAKIPPGWITEQVRVVKITTLLLVTQERARRSGKRDRIAVKEDNAPPRRRSHAPASRNSASLRGRAARQRGPVLHPPAPPPGVQPVSGKMFSAVVPACACLLVARFSDGLCGRSRFNLKRARDLRVTWTMIKWTVIKSRGSFAIRLASLAYLESSA